MKKRYNFTLDEDVMEWLKYYCKENRTNCSSFINQTLADLHSADVANLVENLDTDTRNKLIEIEKVGNCLPSFSCNFFA